MKPGRIVASPRSMTRAFAGAVVGFTAVMRLPSTTTTALRTSVSDVPSNRRAALITVGCANATEGRNNSALSSFFIRATYQTSFRMDASKSGPSDRRRVLDEHTCVLDAVGQWHGRKRGSRRRLRRHRHYLASGHRVDGRGALEDFRESGRARLGGDR